MTSKSSKRRAKSHSKKTLSVIITILVILLFASWYLFGKPYIVQDEQGFMLVMTEEPIIPIGVGTDSVEQQVSPVVSEENPAGPEPVEGLQEVPAKGKNSNISSSAADLGHAEDSPLFFGNPSDALAETSLDTNYLMVKPQFTLSYNTSTLCPNWVAWHLDSVKVAIQEIKLDI